jgi:hypothetical protein
MLDLQALTRITRILETRLSEQANRQHRTDAQSQQSYISRREMTLTIQSDEFKTHAKADGEHKKDEQEEHEPNTIVTQKTTSQETR